MYLEDTDLKEAAKSSSDEKVKPLTVKELKHWIDTLPEKVKNETLFALLDGKETPQTVHRILYNRFLKERKTEPPKTPCPKRPSKK
jgi:hypothetical protein